MLRREGPSVIKSVLPSVLGLYIGPCRDRSLVLSFLRKLGMVPKVTEPDV